jgi:hypothetical protein
MDQALKDLFVLAGIYVIGIPLLLGLLIEGMERLSRWYIHKIIRG